MPRVTKYKPLYPWLGGLNTSLDPMILDPQNLTIADNIIFASSGSRKKRGGQIHNNSTPIPSASAAENIVFLNDYWSNVSNVKTEYAVAVSDSGHVYRSPFNGVWSSFSTLTLSVAQGGVTACVMNEDLILGIKGSGVPKVWVNQNTSTNLVDLTATSGVLPFSSAWICVRFLERLCVAGDPSFPDRIYFSETGSSSKWTQTGSAGGALTLDVGTGDGDPSGITAIFPGTGADRILYAAKRKHIYRINCSDLNQANWSVQPITDEIGCVGQNTVATIDMDDVIFASDRGVHTLSQILTTTAIKESEFLSFPIQYDYNNVITTSQRDRMCAAYIPSINSYLLGCKRVGQTIYETIYAYNIELKQWYRWTNTPCNFLMSRFNKSTGLDELYSAAPGGYVNQLLQTTLNDFGNPIVARIRSAFISPDGIPFTENQFTNLACIYRAHENSTFRVYYSVDGLNTQEVDFSQRIPGGNILGTTILGTTFILGQIQAIKPVWNHLNIGEGTSIQFTFEQDGLNQDFELFGIVLEYTSDEESQNAFTNPVYG